MNFVNNFSEVNGELIEEMTEELQSGNAVVATELAEDIRANNAKIGHHGKRAGDIIKGMLEHSRNLGEGEKQRTDLNALVKEYLQLAHHGMRAKNASFAAVIHTGFDDRIGEVTVAPAEIGRVLLNIYNNAFYAILDKKKKSPGDYEPSVWISTQRLAGKAAICIKDNGNGVAAAIRDKIFQPFFTTKPSGQGTGLGLSLSHDIITKGHGGTLLLNSEEGSYAEFIIHLPL